MKKICVVYRNRQNPAAIAWLDNCLKRVYEDYVNIEDCFMDELEDETRLSADAFLVISSSLLPKLRRHTTSLKNVVTMTRSVKKEYLPAILAIPTGTDVLLVNDTVQSSKEMALMFYELGIGHLNLIPYDKDREQEGLYRGDLYYRLNAIAITLPPLRERREDIPVLFRAFMGKDAARLTGADMDAILRYDWPGNVRELENCALYYKTLGELPQQVMGSRAEAAPHPAAGLQQNVEMQVLALIAQRQAPNHGVGRTELMQGLSAQGVRASDVYLRRLLAALGEQGLVEIGKGRQGTRLTEDGRRALEGRGRA